MGDMFLQGFQLTDVVSLGKDRVAEVVKGQWLTQPQPKAVAVRSPLRETPSFLEFRLRQRGSALFDVRHPALPRYYGYVESSDSLIMDFIPGRDLGSMSGVRKPILRSDWLNIARQIGSALDCLHGMNIFHGSISIRNVKLHDKRVCLVDFGLVEPTAKWYETPARYLAPEVFHAGASGSAATDLYALGVVLYEAALGRDYEGRFAHTDLQNALGEEFVGLVLRLLAPPDERFASARAFIDELESAVRQYRAVPSLAPKPGISSADAAIVANMRCQLEVIAEENVRNGVVKLLADRGAALWLDAAQDILGDLVQGAPEDLEQIVKDEMAVLANGVRTDLRPVDDGHVKWRASETARLLMGFWFILLDEALSKASVIELRTDLLPPDTEDGRLEKAISQLPIDIEGAKNILTRFGSRLLENSATHSLGKHRFLSRDENGSIFVRRG